jgi:hypothetical protein
MKKKILFYGNCQTGAISQYFAKNERLKELFEIIEYDESCAPMHIWREDKTNFAVWTRENRPIQNEIYKSVHEKLKQADIFLFSSTEMSSIEELRTEYICENVSKGFNVCLPNIRLFLYCTDSISLKPYIEYAKTKIKDPNSVQEIASFIKNSDDPELTRILERDYPICTDFERYRNENALRAREDLEKYENYICMEEFIKKNYKTKILSFQHNHLHTNYFIELLKRTLEVLGVSDIEIDEKELKVPGAGQGMVNAKNFKFFNDYFPELDMKDLDREIPIECVIQQLFEKENIK